MSQFVQGPAEPILKPRDLGQLLDQSFKVFGRFWKPLVKVGLVAGIPSILQGLLIGTMLPSVESEDPTNHWLFRIILAAESGDYSGIFAFLTVSGLLVLALFLVAPLFQGALIDVATRAVLHMEPVPLGESLRVGARRYGALLGTYLLKGLIWLIALIIGVPLLVIAGLVIFSFITVPLGLLSLMVVTAFANHAIIVEGKGGGIPALARAFELGKSRFWPLMGIGIVFTLLVVVVQSMITMPFSFAAGIGAAFTQSSWILIMSYLLDGLVTAITTPFLTVGLTLTYFDTRIRREGYDLEVMAQHQQAQAQGDITPPPGPQQ